MSNFKFETVQATVPTSGATFDVTISGFGDVQAVIGVLSPTVANDTITADSNIAVGFLDRQGTPAKGSVGVFSQDAEAIVLSGRTRRTQFMRVVTETGSLLLDFDFNSYITDGVRFDINNAPAAATLCTFYFIGGTDVSDTYFGVHNLGTGTSAQDITAPGFEPTLVFGLGIGGSGTATQTESIFSMGVAVNNTPVEQGSLNFYSKHGESTTVTGSALYNNKFLTQTYNNATQYDVTISDFDASGFSLTCSSSAGSDDIIYLAVKAVSSPSVSLDFIDGPTATGDFTYSAPAFRPASGMLFLSDTTAANTHQDGCSFGLYGFSADSEHGNSVSGLDGSSDSVAKCASSLGIYHLGQDGTVLHDGKFNYFDSNGGSLTFTTVPGTARKMMLLSIGQIPGTSNTAPVLDTSIPDLSIETDTVGSFDCRDYFSDPQGDKIDFTISPALPSGLSLATNGVLSYNGTQAGQGATAYTVTATDQGALTETDTFNITIGSAIPRIDNINTDNIVEAGEAATINTSNFTASPSVTTVTLGGETVTVGSWAGGVLSVTIPLHINLKWGQTYTLSLTADAESATLADVTLNGSPDWESVTVTAVPAAGSTESYAEEAVADIGLTVVAGDVFAWESVAGLSVDSETKPTINPPATVVHDYKFYDESAGSWSSVSEATWTDGGFLTGGARPVITLIGDSVVSVALNGTYTEQGATASDAEDGDITADIVISGDTVNTAVAGTYTINYDVQDSAGNDALTVYRTVNVLAATKTAVLKLVDDDNNIRPDLTDIYYAWYDSNDPSAFGTARTSGRIETTDENGDLVIDLTNTTLPVGGQGSALVYTLTGFSLLAVGVVVQ